MEKIYAQEMIENIELIELENEFINILLHFSNDIEKIKNIFKKLIDAYSEEGRYYHNFKHIQSMLNFLKRNIHEIKNFQALFLATWYHDAKYDTKSKLNEKNSAEMMREDMTNLGLPEELIQYIYDLILATEKHSQLDQDSDSVIFLDADLSILSRPQHIYSVYASNIRKEYSWVPDEDYKRGRKVVLQNFLQREKIFFSPNVEEYEVIARENLRREIELLSQ